MEGRSAVWILAAILLEALMSAEAQNSVKFLEVGGKLVLEPEPVSGSIKSITWKLKGNIVAEWDRGDELEYYASFRGRASMNTITGVLEISDMMKTDSGKYMVEINNHIQSGGYDVRVIKQVPKPDAIMRPLTCSQSSKSCSLSCDGEIKDAGPVTFYFKKGDGDWEEREQNIEIMNNATTQAVETFSCRMKNPLGQKDSEPLNNLFYAESNPGKIVGIVIRVVAAVALVGVGAWLLYKRLKSGSTNDSGTTASRQ